MEGEKHDRLAKILLIGDSGVASLDTGIDFKLKTVDVKNQKIKLQLWDTAGQDKFQTLTATYFKGAHGILLLYSITDKKTFKNVDNWIQQVREKSPENVSIMLVGNKTDLVHDREIGYNEGRCGFMAGQKLAETYKASFVEASAFDGSNVEQAFVQLTELIVARKGGVSAEEGGMKDKLMNSNAGKQISKKCCKS